MRLANHRRMALLSPEMRSKVGSMVSRSSSVSLTSETIRGRAVMLVDSFLAGRGLGSLSLSVPVLEPDAARGLFGAIAADRHAAPPSCPPSGMVGERQGAGVSLACFHVGEIFLTDEFSQRFADRQQQRFRRSPAPHRQQFKASATAMV